MLVYFKLQSLPKEVKYYYKIKSEYRLDCVSQVGLKEYHGLDSCVSTEEHLYFYKTKASSFVNSDCSRIAEWSLTSSTKLNFSSIYLENIKYPQFGYGYPNAKRLLRSGKPNPMFEYRHDGYLFIVNKDISEVEVLVVVGEKNLINIHYQILLDGGYDEELRRFRLSAKSFYDYEGYSKVFPLTKAINLNV